VPIIRTYGASLPVDREIDLAEGAGKWRVPEETPVAFIFNGRNYAVMLATPGDMEDFAVGFSLTERIVNSIDEMEAIEIHYGERGINIRLSIAHGAIDRLDLRQMRRNLAGRAGCGVCGLESAEVFFEKLTRVAESKASLDERALQRALKSLHAHQPLNQRTRSVHAAAWSAPDGEILTAREDVGRHNALDKLLGGRVRSGASDDGFVVMSSRCSYEIVEKAARLGVKAVLSLSAPTAFAIRKAEEANIALYAKAGDAIVAINR